MICPVLAARAAGKLFQTVGPLTSKLRWPVVVRALLIKNKFLSACFVSSLDKNITTGNATMQYSQPGQGCRRVIPHRSVQLLTARTSLRMLRCSRWERERVAIAPWQVRRSIRSSSALSLIIGLADRRTLTGPDRHRRIIAVFTLVVLKPLFTTDFGRRRWVLCRYGRRSLSVCQLSLETSETRLETVSSSMDLSLIIKVPWLRATCFT